MHVPVPIRGPLALPFRVFGITQSKMNPNICTLCERAFRHLQRRRQITKTVTILFADIRGYTAASETMDAASLGALVAAFQDASARAIWAEDGIVNKQMGDGLLAIFNFPIKIERHAEAAVTAALDLQRRWRAALAAVTPRLGAMTADAERGADAAGGGAVGGATALAIGVGVGVHTGAVEIGEFSTTHTEFTAIGGAVNLAARLQAQAAAGEVLVSTETAALAPSLTAGAPTRTLALKGIAAPVQAQVLVAGG